MFNTGIATKLRSIRDNILFKELKYVPTSIEKPRHLIQSKSQAWVGLESIVKDIIQFSNCQTNHALEFGVEFGYSSSALSNYFKKVTGVDIFTGDEHAGFHGDIFELTKSNFKDFPNIELIKSDYRDFIKDNAQQYDLIHVDIVHTYEATYECGLWSAQHSTVTIFHDTESYRDVKRAVAAIAKATHKKFYNYKKYNGLGIVI
ncbi:MAG: class I SAM-dependent methyltransferase [Chryseotalea sp.]|jgi:predicted O-methyltransferase YrrM|nr:class I SAM-dependent methyltransferase [Cytophagales bacterium]